MSFLRHQRSFRPMGKEQTGSRLGAHSRLSSARMSRSRLFLGGSVSTGARFRFIGCGQNAVQWSCRSSNLQRTANSVLFGCLNRGVHPTTKATVNSPMGVKRADGRQLCCLLPVGVETTPLYDLDSADALDKLAESMKLMWNSAKNL